MLIITLAYVHWTERTTTPVVPFQEYISLYFVLYCKLWLLVIQLPGYPFSSNSSSSSPSPCKREDDRRGRARRRRHRRWWRDNVHGGDELPHRSLRRAHTWIRHQYYRSVLHFCHAAYWMVRSPCAVSDRLSTCMLVHLIYP